MTQRKHKSRDTTPTHIHVGTQHYTPLEKGPYSTPRFGTFMRLTGLWLVDAGFSPQDRLTVTVEPGRIVLTRV